MNDHAITHFCPPGPYRVFVRSCAPEAIRSLIDRGALNGEYRDDGFWTDSLRDAQFWRIRLATLLRLDLEQMDSPAFPVQIDPELFQNPERQHLAAFRSRYQRAGWNEQGRILREWADYCAGLDRWLQLWREQLAEDAGDSEQRARCTVAKIAVGRLAEVLKQDQQDIAVWGAVRAN